MKPSHRTPPSTPITALALTALSLFAASGLAQPAPTQPPAQAPAQPPLRATTPAELLEALRAAGVELPQGLILNDDGSVSLTPPPPPAPPPAPAPTPALQVTPDLAPPAQPQAPPAKPKAVWDHKIDFAVNASQGNSETASLRVAYTASREGPRNLTKFDASYFFATQEGDTTQNRATIGAFNDFKFSESSRWLLFSGLRGDYDEFDTFTYRITLNGGVGYKLVDKEKYKFTPRLGSGFAREFDSPRDEIIAEGFAGFDFSWIPSDRQRFNLIFRYLPEYGDLADFRTLTTAEWRYDLDGIGDGLAFNAGLTHEYQSVVGPGIDETDINVYAGITYDF